LKTGIRKRKYGRLCDSTGNRDQAGLLHALDLDVRNINLGYTDTHTFENASGIVTG
jgi:hypothetical protein